MNIAIKVLACRNSIVLAPPISNQYPAMIELFTRKLDAIQLPENAVLAPLTMDEDISSLSAILLDDDYYEFLKQGKVAVDGVTVLDAA